MKTKNFKFKSMALVLFALVLSSNVWGQSTTYTSNVTFNAGTNGSDCSVVINSTSYDGMKLGTGKATGTITFNIPTGTTTIHIHTAGWKGDGATRTLNISTNKGKFSNNTTSTTIALINDDGVANNTPFTLSAPEEASSSYYAKLSISGVTAQATITCTTSAKRAVVWGVNTESATSYTVTKTLNNCSVTGTAIPATTTTGFSTTISANSGYELPSTISVTGASHTWDASTGALTIFNVTGNVSITITATAAKTLSSIAVTIQPTKKNYTTCETLDLSGCVVTATYSDKSTENVTSSCTFNPADGAALTKSVTSVAVSYSGKNTTITGISVTDGARDTFVDKVQGTEDQYGECNGYTIPSCGDKTKGAGCEGEHYKFIGWSSTRIQTGVETEPAGLLKAGNKHDADGATYYAVWAKEEQE